MLNLPNIPLRRLRPKCQQSAQKKNSKHVHQLGLLTLLIKSGNVAYSLFKEAEPLPLKSYFKLRKAVNRFALMNLWPLQQTTHYY